jgi:hypothetical protein
MVKVPLSVILKLPSFCVQAAMNNTAVIINTVTIFARNLIKGIYYLPI